jgi:hypothetical protein
MRLLKKAEKIEPVSRQEFEALAAQLESFKAIATLAVAAIGFAMNSAPSTPDANPRRRLEKIAGVSNLDASEQKALAVFLKALDAARKNEFAREFAEAQESTKPRRPESFLPMSWRG